MKQVVGMVVSNKMQKSVVVAVDRLFHHKMFNRYIKRTSKFMAHDENNLCNIGDRVSIANNLPIFYLSLQHRLYQHYCVAKFEQTTVFGDGQLCVVQF